MSDRQIPLASPYLAEAELQAVTDALRSGRLSIGPYLETFEAAVAEAAGRQFAVGVNSGTSALHLCVRALGIGEGDEVITTPFSFIATTNCILFERARPVFVDIDPDSYNLDPDAVADAITVRTRAILPVEVFGNTAHFDRYERIAARHGLAMIEDSCEALGGRLGDRPAGSFGDCGAFAFYPNKQITTGEGGMVVTDSPRIRELCVSMRNQGRDCDDWFRHPRLGFNYRMSELTAALGSAQVVRLDAFVADRRRVADLYRAALGEIDEIHLPPMADPDRASPFVYVVRLAETYDHTSRDAILEHLRAAGIGCNNYFAPIHTQPYIRKLLGTGEGDFPHTEHVAARTIALPFFTEMTERQVHRVRDALKDALARGDARGRRAAAWRREGLPDGSVAEKPA